MKVLIVNNMVPFTWGEADDLAVDLQRNLITAGHEAEILRIPFQLEPAQRIPQQMLMVRAFELWNVDHVIALRFPAYLIRHATKTLWLIDGDGHFGDPSDGGQTDPAPGLGEGNGELRALIKNADNQSFAESRRIFTTSEVTRQGLLRYSGFDASVLPVPVNDPESWPQTVEALLR